jgi:hypothetical protein
MYLLVFGCCGVAGLQLQRLKLIHADLADRQYSMAASMRTAADNQ